MPHGRYAIFDEKTGEVVHIHVDAPGVETSPEELIEMVDPERRQGLAVRSLPEDLASRPVHVEREELRPVDDETVAHGGAKAAGPMTEPAVARRYERQAPKRP